MKCLLHYYKITPMQNFNQSRRKFIKQGAVISFAGMGLGSMSSQVLAGAIDPPADGDIFKLPPLPYPYEALEPHIDKMTMQIHHDKHHATYVTKLNEVFKGAVGLTEEPPLDLLFQSL